MGSHRVPCYRWSSAAFVDDEAAAEHAERTAALVAMIDANPAVWQPCDVELDEDDEPPPQVAPELLAEAYVHSTVLHPPTPTVRPGGAVVGLPAHLEPGGTTHVPPVVEPATPYGTFTATATPELVVDWGEGAVDATSGEVAGPISYGAATGGPWPHGDVTFTYRDVGAFDVVVTRRWRFDWSFSDGPSGSTTVDTEGRIDELAVGELQARREW